MIDEVVAVTTLEKTTDEVVAVTTLEETTDEVVADTTLQGRVNVGDAAGLCLDADDDDVPARYDLRARRTVDDSRFGKSRGSRGWGENCR